jgi:hypothetical protein
MVLHQVSLFQAYSIWRTKWTPDSDALKVLSIVLSVLLRFTDFDYPFGIFKLFFIQRFAKQTDYNRINLDLSIPCVTHILNGKLEQKGENVEDYSLWCFWSNWTLLIKICVQYFQRIDLVLVVSGVINDGFYHLRWHSWLITVWLFS